MRKRFTGDPVQVPFGNSLMLEPVQITEYQYQTCRAFGISQLRKSIVISFPLFFPNGGVHGGRNWKIRSKTWAHVCVGAPLPEGG